MKEKHLSIWFLIGLQLDLYGVLITSVSIYDWLVPSTQTEVILADLHAGVWLGLIMLILGLVYTRKFWPVSR